MVTDSIHDRDSSLVRGGRAGGRGARCAAPADREVDARTAAWCAFGEATRSTASGSERLRLYAAACEAARQAYHFARLLGNDR
jgi:hypothetical protein